MSSVEARKAKMAGIARRGAEEMRRFVFVAAYMVVVFGAFAVYRRLIMQELGVPYLHYSVSVIAALVVAKVVLMGEALKAGQRYRPGALIGPVLYKAVLYTALVVAFVAVERVVEGLVHGETGRRLFAITLAKRDELLANTLMVFVAFIPFFALMEFQRAYGPDTSLFNVFFRKSDIEGRLLSEKRVATLPPSPPTEI